MRYLIAKGERVYNRVNSEHGGGEDLAYMNEKDRVVLGKKTGFQTGVWDGEGNFSARHMISFIDAGTLRYALAEPTKSGILPTASNVNLPKWLEDLVQKFWWVKWLILIIILRWIFKKTNR